MGECLHLAPRRSDSEMVDCSCTGHHTNNYFPSTLSNTMVDCVYGHWQRARVRPCVRVATGLQLAAAARAYIHM